MHTILRTYNNTGVLHLIKSLTETGLIDQFTVVINSKDDHIGTDKLLRTLNSTTPIVTVHLNEYGWSKALNAGLRSLPPIRRNDELVMIVSNSVHIIPSEVRLLKEAASMQDASCGYALFQGRDELTYQLPRNTYIVWKRSLFEVVGLFDESLDNDTGMEDYEMVLRVFKATNGLPFLGPKHVRIDLRSDVTLADKLAWESRGVQMIERRYSNDIVHKVRNHIKQQKKT